VTLPPLSGPFAVARTTVYVQNVGATASEQMAHLWYPAERNSTFAPYIPNWNQARQALTAQQKQQGAKAVFEGMEAGRIVSQVSENAPLQSSGRLPVLIFSHGLGVSSLLYSSQLADLASHGYVVAGVEHEFSTFRVFRDGRVTGFDPAHWRTDGKSPEERIRIEKEHIEVLAAEIQLVYNALAGRQPSTIPSDILRHLDLDRIGVFGHSYGARAAIRSCQLEPRFRACLNQDGLSQGFPFHKDESGKGVTQPVLFVLRQSPYLPELVLTDADLQKQGVTREAATQQSSEVKAKIIEALSSVQGGSAWFSIHSPRFSHMSYTDLPLLEAAGTEDRRNALRALEIVVEVTRRFFDRTVKGLNGETGLPQPPEVTKVFEWPAR
jgi:pimeloyl-ACP methyl ester carboxylesterase